MATEIQLTDDVVLPVMEKYEIDKEEAEKRLQLLFKSGIMDDPQPSNNLWQKRVDTFLHQKSIDLEKAVIAQVAVSKCIDDKKFVREYDRLNDTNFAKMIRLVKEGEIVIGWDTAFKKFEEFVIKNIVTKFYN